MPPQPPAIVAPAPVVKKPGLPIVVQPAPAPSASPLPVSDAAVRAAFVQQAGALRAAQETANATLKAAQAAANMAWWAAILALTGAVFAALVAWRNGWLATRTTQQVKHADYRQAWIDKLREELARFLRIASENDVSRDKDPLIKESIAAIVLRMDKDDPEYNELVGVMGEIANESSKGELLGATDKISKYLLVSQRILKREWEVTKHDMHATPWGRPISWFVNRHRRRRREEEKEIVRRAREKLPLAPPKKLAKPLRWPIQWRRRQKPPRDPNAPVFTIGRIEIKKREPAPPKPPEDAG